MNVEAYIRQKFQLFGVKLTDADILDMCLSSNINEGDEMNDECHTSVSVAIARFIPSLLLRPSSVNESGFSMSWDTNGMRNYYLYLCKQYGLKDELTDKPKVTFL